MATRSRIAIQNKDGTLWSVYCHWDGQVYHNGKILVEHYETEEQVRFLINQGDMSSLDIKPQLCEHYHRKSPHDEPLIILGSLSFEQVVQQAKTEGSDFLYLFKDGDWWVKVLNTRLREENLQLVFSLI